MSSKKKSLKKKHHDSKSTSHSKKDEDAQHETKMPRKDYEKELQRLQVELVKMQSWVKHVGARIVVVFEGRDAAGKGGVIKRITERVSPRVFRVVALPAPSSRERTQLYTQRYIAHMPAAGEIVLFDRSWYNRLGVERVLGFCTNTEYEKFLRNCDGFEQGLISDGIILIKYWLSVSHEEQVARFKARIEDPLRQWKLSGTDLYSVQKWYDYSIARDQMMMATDTELCPWTIVPSDDKRRSRLNCIRHFLETVPYEDVPQESVEIPERELVRQYDDVASLQGRRFVPEYYQ